MYNDDIANANTAGNRLKRVILSKVKNSNIDTLLADEILKLSKSINDKDYNLFMQTVTPIYIKYKVNMPNVLYKILRDDEAFTKIGWSFILGLKGANKPQKQNTIEIDGEICYDIKTIMEKLGVAKITVQRWLAEGKLHKANSKQMKKTYIKKSEIDNFVKGSD